MRKIAIVALAMFGVALFAGCSRCNSCQKAPKCNTCKPAPVAAPCSTCDK